MFLFTCAKNSRSGDIKRGEKHGLFSYIAPGIALVTSDYECQLYLMTRTNIYMKATKNCMVNTTNL